MRLIPEPLQKHQRQKRMIAEETALATQSGADAAFHCTLLAQAQQMMNSNYLIYIDIF